MSNDTPQAKAAKTRSRYKQKLINLQKVVRASYAQLGRPEQIGEVRNMLHEGYVANAIPEEDPPELLQIMGQALEESPK